MLTGDSQHGHGRPCPAKSASSAPAVIYFPKDKLTIDGALCQVVASRRLACPMSASAIDSLEHHGQAGGTHEHRAQESTAQPFASCWTSGHFIGG